MPKVTSDDSIAEYVRGLGGGPLAISRVQRLLRTGAKIMAEAEFRFDDGELFICDRVEDDGKRRLVNLLYFSPEAIIEWHNFIPIEKFDIVMLRRSIWGVMWSVRNYDMITGQASNEDLSRISVDTLLDRDIRLKLFATGENCVYLDRIVKKYLIPNLTSSWAGCNSGQVRDII